MADNGSLRRKFVDIHRSQGSPIAEEAIGRIAQLYAVEKEARGSPPDRRIELRKAHAAPVDDRRSLYEERDISGGAADVEKQGAPVSQIPGQGHNAHDAGRRAGKNGLHGQPARHAYGNSTAVDLQKEDGSAYAALPENAFHGVQKILRETTELLASIRSEQIMHVRGKSTENLHVPIVANPMDIIVRRVVVKLDRCGQDRGVFPLKRTGSATFGYQFNEPFVMGMNQQDIQGKRP